MKTMLWTRSGPFKLGTILLFLLGLCVLVDAYRRVLTSYDHSLPIQAFHMSVNESQNDDYDTTHRRRSLRALSAEDHRVTSLPGLDESMDSKLVQYAGHIEINAKKGSNIYYWLFEKPENPQDGTGSSLYIFIFSIFAYEFCT
jgi:hypothetical protein